MENGSTIAPSKCTVSSAAVRHIRRADAATPPRIPAAQALVFYSGGISSAITTLLGYV
jgi:hypothetical protein